MDETPMVKAQTGAVRSRIVGRLSEKNHAELLALLEQLVQRQPDIEPLLELLIELPLATTTQERSRPGKGRERTLDPSPIRSQVASAFYNASKPGSLGFLQRGKRMGRCQPCCC